MVRKCVFAQVIDDVQVSGELSLLLEGARGLSRDAKPKDATTYTYISGLSYILPTGAPYILLDSCYAVAPCVHSSVCALEFEPLFDR
jgi:hypothetical protein